MSYSSIGVPFALADSAVFAQCRDRLTAAVMAEITGDFPASEQNSWGSDQYACTSRQINDALYLPPPGSATMTPQNISFSTQVSLAAICTPGPIHAERTDNINGTIRKP